jgi:hypothetical protein
MRAGPVLCLHSRRQSRRRNVVLGYLRAIQGLWRLLRWRQVLRSLRRTLLILRPVVACYRLFSTQITPVPLHREAPPSPFYSANLANSRRQGKAFCKQRAAVSQARNATNSVEKVHLSY